MRGLLHGQHERTHTETESNGPVMIDHVICQCHLLLLYEALEYYSTLMLLDHVYPLHLRPASFTLSFSSLDEWPRAQWNVEMLQLVGRGLPASAPASASVSASASASAFERITASANQHPVPMRGIKDYSLLVPREMPDTFHPHSLIASVCA